MITSQTDPETQRGLTIFSRVPHHRPDPYDLRGNQTHHPPARARSGNTHSPSKIDKRRAAIILKYLQQRQIDLINLDIDLADRSRHIADHLDIGQRID